MMVHTRLVRVLEGDVEHLGEILTQMVGGCSLQSTNQIKLLFEGEFPHPRAESEVCLRSVDPQKNRLNYLITRSILKCPTPC